VKGAAEEDLALRFLEARGLKLVARNFRCRGAELDLVMRDGGTLVVAEVRKRSHPGFGSGAESVDARKRGRLLLAAQAFLASHAEFLKSPVRFDIIALDRDDRVEWLRAAFDAGDA
jgi:putative endonuclease